MARQNGLVVQEMPGEVLVYDLDSNKAHCLNESAATVWRSCDGNNSVADAGTPEAVVDGTPWAFWIFWISCREHSRASTTRLQPRSRANSTPAALVMVICVDP